ncbi:MAG: hypothetical protein MUD08_01890 [Cytophagales bacterium]|nr:hypothetical protein [Cytophagales bacterium]
MVLIVGFAFACIRCTTTEDTTDTPPQPVEVVTAVPASLGLDPFYKRLNSGFKLMCKLGQKSHAGSY